jgi:hypothetical protein
MKKKSSRGDIDSAWSFALVNGRLAEVFFKIKKEKTIIDGHCLVKREGYTTKYEQRMIDNDTKKYKLTLRKGVYTRQPVA